MRPDKRRGRKRKMEAKTTVARPTEKVTEDEQENVELTQDLNKKINFEFKLLYPDDCNNFFTKWGTYFRERIITLQIFKMESTITTFKNAQYNVPHFLSMHT
ncbi:Hypothetical predicted protein [Paramuricea clavata]|uniref:Uncharacterized protein n=1 Tax=Paramuricea clavata TaxID=317549 RepID=A0A7D9IDQ0_PARCT|nr:Hypothetical predicted protein [Paramuricea clavata]